MRYHTVKAFILSACIAIPLIGSPLVAMASTSKAQATVAPKNHTITGNPFAQITPVPSRELSYLQMLNSLSLAAPTANPKVIAMALSALDCALADGMEPARNLTLIDYSLVSTIPRLWVFDLSSGKLLFHELVAHGMKTGKNVARHFSNTYGSHQTSLGLFRTKETYMGANGYSLRMEGLESGFNDKARERAIVFHGADYVDPKLAQKLGYLGRSHGCPAVRRGVAKKVIDTIKGEQFLFSYYPDKQWLNASKFLNCPHNQRLAQNDIQ